MKLCVTYSHFKDALAMPFNLLYARPLSSLSSSNFAKSHPPIKAFCLKAHQYKANRFHTFQEKGPTHSTNLKNSEPSYYPPNLIHHLHQAQLPQSKPKLTIFQATPPSSTKLHHQVVQICASSAALVPEPMLSNISNIKR